MTKFYTNDDLCLPVWFLNFKSMLGNDWSFGLMPESDCVERDYEAIVDTVIMFRWSIDKWLDSTSVIGCASSEFVVKYVYDLLSSICDWSTLKGDYSGIRGIFIRVKGLSPQ